MRGIVSAYTEEYRPHIQLAMRSWTNHSILAGIHVEDLGRASRMRAHIGKLTTMRNACGLYGGILWVDADTIMMRQPRWSMLPDDKIAMVRDPGRRYFRAQARKLSFLIQEPVICDEHNMFNSGVLWVPRSMTHRIARACDVIREAWENSDGTEWIGDQIVLHHILKPSEIEELPPNWNVWPGKKVKDPIFNHAIVPNANIEDKLKWMEEQLNG